MPLLAALIINIASALSGWLATYVTKKLAVGMAAIAVLSGLLLGLYATLSLLLNSIASAFPAMPGASIGIWVAVPDMLPACFSAIISTDTAIALFRWSYRNVTLLAQSN